MYHWINALVVDKIFAFKKFITNQRDLDDFTGNSSLGMVIMNIMKIEKPEQLPFWNAYKEIVKLWPMSLQTEEQQSQMT